MDPSEYFKGYEDASPEDFLGRLGPFLPHEGVEPVLHAFAGNKPLCDRCALPRSYHPMSTVDALQMAQRVFRKYAAEHQQKQQRLRMDDPPAAAKANYKARFNMRMALLCEWAVKAEAFIDGVGANGTAGKP